ncbi:MAG: hypothetical protein JKY65_12930 [Planctomycetes bacterium]|nr:hypothetical protein [Planctomycetota bacterium]
MTPSFRRWLVFFSVILFLLAGVAVFGPRGQEAYAQEKTGKAAAKTPGPPKGAKDEAQVDRRIDLSALKGNGSLGTTPLDRLRSLFGMAVLIMICVAMSNNPRKISWKLVAWGLGLQIMLGLIVLSPFGNSAFDFANTLFTELMNCSTEGSKFLFGKLAQVNNVPVGPGGAFGPVGANGQVAEIGAYFAFSVLPTIIFFSALMAVLYHLGVMQFVVRHVAWVMQRTMGTSGSETLSASGNIFVGQTEAPLLVRPYIEGMTKSELMAVMTGGFATVAGGVMAAYVGFLQGAFTGIAGHLLSASVMSAPAALVCAKIMIPEPDPEKSETYGELKVELEKVDSNVIDAAARGAGDGLKLALNVGAMLLAFLALVYMFNQMVGFAAGQVADGYYGNDWEERVSDVRKDLKEAKGLKDMVARTKAEAVVSKDLSALALEALGNPEGLVVTVDLASEATASQITTGSLTLNPADLEAKTPAIKGIALAGVKPSASPYRYMIEDLTLEAVWRTLSIEKMLGWLLAPLAFLMGVPMVDCVKIGQLIGIKTVVNEFVSYIQLSNMMANGELQHPRSVIIAVYSLCGFANFGSIAIQIGGIGGIAPSRRHDLAKLGLRAMIAGTIACLLTATVAGMLIS